MKHLFTFVAFLSCSLVVHAQDDDYAYDAGVIKEIYTEALTQQNGYKWLRELTNIGGRLAGSEEANKAIYHFQKKADSLGFTTYLQKVTVPHWERGEKEIAHYKTNGITKEVRSCALGGSVATPKKGLTANVVEVSSFEELDALDAKMVKGKIIFYNMKMDPSFINTFFAYSNAVKQRWAGAVEASKKGAAGVVIRSLSSSINPYPHTGSMTYQGAEEKIPAIAISTLDAEALSKDLKEDPKLKFYFKTNCVQKDSAESFNLIAEIKGYDLPDDIILIGGHIDSWDLGTGAHDDGAGSIHALEAAYLLKKLTLHTKRTVRVVFFMNEEFGLDGARTYAAESKAYKLNHVIAIESDAGGFSPRGISMVAPDSIVNKIKGFRGLLEPYGIHRFSQNGAGADISQLYAEDLVMIGMRPDNHRYFEVHHSERDVFENVNARELEMGSATLASLIYLLDKYDIVAR